MKINIGIGIDDSSCQHCASTIASVLVNSDKADEYVFYIICNELSDKNINNLEKLKKIRDFSIVYMPIDEKELKKFTANSNMDIASFFKFKFFGLENIDKILYLDSDTIVRKDIKTLYSTNIEKYCIAGAKDIIWRSLKKQYSLSEDSIYVNTGVLLINVKRTRKIDLLPYMSMFHVTYGKINYSGQDVINYIFQEKILEFDIKYNYSFPYQTEYDTNHYKSIAEDPGILHYITDRKPWIPGTTSYMKSEYFKYLKYTPYYKDFMPTYQIEENSFIISRLNDMLRLMS